MQLGARSSHCNLSAAKASRLLPRRRLTFVRSQDRQRRQHAWPSCSGSAEREAIVAHESEFSEKVSSSFRRRASNHGCFTPSLRRLKDESRASWQPTPSAAAKVTSGRCRVTARHASGLRWQALPNPSLKASPNSVAHWPSSAGPAAHFALALQRATLSGPP